MIVLDALAAGELLGDTQARKGIVARLSGAGRNAADTGSSARVGTIAARKRRSNLG